MLTRKLISSLWFFCFQNFVSYNFTLFKDLLLYIWPLIYLFVLGRDTFFTVYICFKENLFFNFLYKLFNKYFSLPQSTYQFRVYSFIIKYNRIQFYYKIMKKPHMHAIIGSSGSDCVLIILFQLYGSKAGAFWKSFILGGSIWSSNVHIGRRTDPILI